MTQRDETILVNTECISNPHPLHGASAVGSRSMPYGDAELVQHGLVRGVEERLVDIEAACVRRVRAVPHPGLLQKFLQYGASPPLFSFATDPTCTSMFTLRIWDSFPEYTK